MIAPRINEQTLRFISLGLDPKEQELLKHLSSEIPCELQIAQDDLDLWSHARYGSFDVCILGQSEEIPDPSYLVWLLKGIAGESQIILIYSTLNKEEAERLERFDAAFVLKRPVKPDQLTHTIDSALNGKGVRKVGFWSKLSGLLAHRS